MPFKILAINPGSTSTKIAFYEDEKAIFMSAIEAPFDNSVDQFTLRRDCVVAALTENGVNPGDLSAIVGRGGQMPPVKCGGYLVNEAMLSMLRSSGGVVPHASNLGAGIAHSIAFPLGIPAYIYDAVSADELYDVAKITGIPEITRQSFCHVLNAKATARKVAESLGKTYEALNFIVAHIGAVFLSAPTKRAALWMLLPTTPVLFRPSGREAFPWVISLTCAFIPALPKRP
jgi:butyrate kinase